MLVLSRKAGEQIVIGEGIVVVVKRITGHRVTLGIEAPSNVHIVRGELEPLAHPAVPAPLGKTTTAAGSVGAPVNPENWNAALAAAKPR